MSEYKQIEETVDVPMDAGVDGFLMALRAILTLSRVTELRINTKGQVIYKRWTREDDDANANLRMDFDSVTPVGIVRNNEIIDVGVVDENEAPATVVCHLLNRVEVDHMYPTVFVVGTNSVFFEWFAGSGVEINKTAERFFGHKLMKDRFIEDDILLLCAGYGPGGGLVDTRITYKMTMPAREAPVRILPGVDDEAFGSDGEGWADRRGEAVGAPEMGSTGTRPAGRTEGLPDLGVPGGGHHGHRTGHGGPGAGGHP